MLRPWKALFQGISHKEEARPLIRCISYHRRDSNGVFLQAPLLCSSRNFGPISETPETSPHEMEKLPTVHLRRLMGEPTPEKKPVAPLNPVKEEEPSGLDTIEKVDEARDALLGIRPYRDIIWGRLASGYVPASCTFAAKPQPSRYMPHFRIRNSLIPDYIVCLRIMTSWQGSRVDMNSCMDAHASVSCFNTVISVNNSYLSLYYNHLHLLFIVILSIICQNTTSSAT